ncbi:MAG: transposase [Bacteroidales bacterium]|nr:transposase [Bacteroidales bacterium]
MTETQPVDAFHNSVLKYIVTLQNSSQRFCQSFNTKIKSFMAQLRGMADIEYFLFCLSDIYA